MKGYPTSFAGLFEVHPDGGPRVGRVEIPLIQRDYAQGRESAAVEEIRSTFLEVLLAAIDGGEPVGLDFVYGKVDESGTLQPLDGQQRLTTLFLLHWYLASAAETLDSAAAWTRFSYSTRFSARRFCERLAEHSLPRELERPSAWIVDQPWYLHVWKDDPTIQAMLVMIDAIHDQIRRVHPDLDPKFAWERLTDAESAPVSFHLLPLDDMYSDEDLYIKMNSRGKPLTPFESFKARFEQDIRHSQRAREFAHKIDGAWSDMLWPYHGGDNIVDDEFLRYIDYLTEICELRDGQVSAGRLATRARAVFGQGNPRAEEHLGFLFDAFDAWRGSDHIEEVFDSAFATALAGTDHHNNRVVLFGAKSTNLLDDCFHQFDGRVGRNRAFTLQLSLLLYAVLLHVIEGTDDFLRRLRVLRNLISASEDEVRRDRMPELIRDVEAVIRTGDLEGIARLSSNQVEDERRKQQFLDEHPDLAADVFRLEDHPILRGTLSAFELEPEMLRSRARAFAAVFADPQQWPALTGALLATGEYQRQRPNSLAWQFGTSSANNEGVWRYLLTSGTRDGLTAIRAVLSDFLDGVAAAGADVKKHLHSVMTDWLAEREAAMVLDWRYYLVKYPSMRSGDTGIYVGIEGELGYSMCMMRRTQLNSYYRDPILLAVWESSGVGEKVIDPWFTGYETKPRWLRLLRSEAGMRSISSGFALEAPEDEPFRSRFMDMCSRRDDIEATDESILLRIPQTERDERLVDSVDRVVVGASFLRELVGADI